jgi:hypothetical protein
VSSTPNFSATQVASPALRDQLLILSLIKDIRTAVPVQVMAVHPGSGNPPAIGTVDIQPLIQTVDGTGKRWNLGITYGAPFCRIQAGNTAIVVDPSEGDIGLAVACDRDISSLLSAANLAIAQGMPVQPSGPGSARTHDISDLVYLFSIISAAEITQYILANADGIKLLSPNTITIQGQQINLVGPVTQTNGDVSIQTQVTVPTVIATTDVLAGPEEISSVNHTHTSATPGSPTSPPIP